MLKRVKIQGYKSLADVEVHLQPLSVLFGPNASGKSNFLDALQVLTKIPVSNTIGDIFEPPYRGQPLEAFTYGPHGKQDLLAKEEVSFSIEVDVEFSQQIIEAMNNQIQVMIQARSATRNVNQIVWNAFGQITLVQEKHLRYYIQIGFIPKRGKFFIVSESFVPLNAEMAPATESFLKHTGKLITLNENGQSIEFPDGEEKSILSVPFYTASYPYLEALRRELTNWFFYYLEPLDYMRTPSPLREVRHIGLRGEELDAFLNTLRNLDAPQFDAVEKALHAILPSFTGIDIKINTRGETELSLIEGQTPVSVRVLSEGTLRILGLLAIVSTKKAPYLIGIEEPENSVNANRLDLIALLLENRASDDTQVLATTHSPTLIDFISDESLYFFRLSKSNGNSLIESLTDWKKRNLKSEAIQDFRERTPLSDRILRGDFNA